MAAPATTVAKPTADERRAERFAARSVCHDLSSLKRVRACGRFAASSENGVTVKATGSAVDGTRRAGFGGAAVCGSAWSCPVCAAKIQARRQADVSRALEVARERGWTVLFLTLTMRHAKDHKLAYLWKQLSTAWRYTTSGNQRAWKSDKDSFGIQGYIRLVEGTHGDNGWHLHAHVLLFLDPNKSDRANDLWGSGGFTRDDELELGTSMFLRWREQLKGGLRPSKRHGVDVRRVSTDEDVARYFAKGVYSRKSIGSTAHDVTGSVSKDSRHGNRTPFGILRSLVLNKETGEVGPDFARDLALWHTWENASRGKSQLHWSRGLRDDLGLTVELTDQEAAEDDAGGEVLATMTASQYRALAARGVLLDVLRSAEVDDSGDTLRGFLAWGLELYAPPRE